MGYRKCLDVLKSNVLLICTFVGVAVGFGLGFGIRYSEANPNADVIIWLGTPGDVYMRLLKMTILPLVASSIIMGTSSLDPKSSGRLGGLATMLVVVNNALGSVLAILLFFIFKPGEGGTLSEPTESNPDTTHIETGDMFLDLIRNVFPDNVITACFQKVQTRYTTSEMIQEINGTNITILTYHRYQGTSGGVNTIGLIVICSIFGIASSRTSEEVRKPFVDLFNSISEIVQTVLHWIVRITPLGVASLIAASIAGVDNVKDIFERIGMFILALTFGIVIHQVILIPLVYFIAIRKNPFKFIASCARPWMTAFAPPSTAIAMPEMMNTLEKRNDIDRRISRFSVPFGAALIRVGSCLFICLSALFLMVLEGEEITAIRVLLAGVLTTVGSLAIPAVPSASIITVLVVLSSFNVQTLNIGLLMALEWYSDRIRSTSNTMTVLLSSVLLQKFCKLDDKYETENHEGGMDIKIRYETPTEQSTLKSEEQTKM